MAKPDTGSLSRLAMRSVVPILVLGGLWVLPVPQGLPPQAWHMLAIFAAAICAILTQPLPTGAVMIIALSVAALTRTLPLDKALSGFSNGVVWLIFCAYVLALGFVKSGLGRRIAYRMLAWFGGSSLGIAYALGITDLIIAPATPSVTARSGGIIFPVVRSINEALGSSPGPTGKRIGDFLTMVCFQFTPITGAMFLTGMAANPLVAALAHRSLKVDISWGHWFVAAAVPCAVCFLLMPQLVYRILNPSLKRTPEARELGRESLARLGPMSGLEIRVVIGFVLALLGWGTSLLTGLDATLVGLVLVAYFFITGSISWSDVLADRAAWDTVIWFGAIISLATGLSSLGFIKWMSMRFSADLAGWGAMTTFVVLGLCYIYVHYAFATASGHVAALYVPFAALAVAAGAPPMMVAICFGIFSNLMWGNTEYGGGPGPIYFAQGYFGRPRFYAVNLAVVTSNVLITFAVGMAWWKVIGLW